MAIKVFTGLPGSGKSYRVVNDISKPSIYNKYYIIHNIDGLKDDEIGFGENIRPLAEVLEIYNIKEEQFLTQEWMSKITSEITKKYNRPILLILDEGQRQFGNRRYSQEKDDLLTYHRHCNMDIWLITQDIRKIDRGARALIELEIRSSRTPAIPFFIYRHLVGDKSISISHVRPRKKIFDLYKSFDFGDGKTGNKSNFLLYILIFFCFFGSYVLWAFKAGPLSAYAGGRDIQKTQNQNNNFSEPGQKTEKKDEFKEKFLALLEEKIEKDSEYQQQLKEKNEFLSNLQWAGYLKGEPMFWDGRILASIDEFCDCEFLSGDQKAAYVVSQEMGAYRIKRHKSGMWIERM